VRRHGELIGHTAGEALLERLVTGGLHDDPVVLVVDAIHWSGACLQIVEATLRMGHVPRVRWRRRATAGRAGAVASATLECHPLPADGAPQHSVPTAPPRGRTPPGQ